MNNKYYTPDLEEFHPGFEFEYKPRVRNGITAYIEKRFEYKDHWLEWVFGTEEYDFYEILNSRVGPNSIVDIREYLKDKAIKIKYLDQEDIVSLGWEKLREDTFEMKLPEYRGLTDVLVHLVLRKTLLICVGDSESPYSDWRTLFTGTIKNKSELKKVMKMIGI